MFGLSPAIFIAFALLLAGNATFFKLWQDTKGEYIAYAAGASAIAKQAIADKEAKEREGEDNLTELRAEHESKVPEIRAGAVAAYLAAHRVRRPHPSGGEVPGTGPGIRVDDGKVTECVPDQAFIEDAAEAETKLAAWQRYGQLNHLPVED